MSGHMSGNHGSGHAGGEGALTRSFGPVMIWGLGVGYVISGSYFGWNLGLPGGGPFGMLIAAAVVTVLYVTFVLGYAELACAMPRAGGAFVYTTRAFGKHAGFVGGAAQLVEYVFAPPAIAFGIGSYIDQVAPGIATTLRQTLAVGDERSHQLSILGVAIAAYVVFTGINMAGAALSARLELVITVIATVEIVIFGIVCLPHFTWDKFTAGAPAFSWSQVFVALPFAMWFYLAIEGVANVAEEAKDPQRDLPRGFLFAMGTLVVLASIAFFGAVGADGWRSVVYPPGSETPSDSPLPLAIGHVIGRDHLMFQLLTSVGLLGLVASFHGILLAASRATMELGRAGSIPSVFGRIHPRRKTPVAALALNMVVGIAALFTGRTGDIILLSVFGALVLYIMSTVALFVLRRREPELPRPYKTPLYPVVPAVSLVLSLVVAAAFVWANPLVVVFFAVVVAVLFGVHLTLSRR